MPKEQRERGPKEEASQRLVAHASDAASAEPLPCARLSQSIVQPFHKQRSGPPTAAIASPEQRPEQRSGTPTITSSL